MKITEELEIELTTEEIEELIRDLPRILYELDDDKDSTKLEVKRQTI